MPSTNSIYEERIELLDKLIDLPLRGFPELDATPTSGITSLPTPHGEEHPSLADHVEPSHDVQMLYPSAPLIKDLDSFTEGTGGALTFLLKRIRSRLIHLLIPPPYHSYLHKSPRYSSKCGEKMYITILPIHPSHHQRLEESIDSSSSDSSSSHSKRPRSVASDDVARRTRIRAQSAAASPYATDTQFYVGVAPPPADVRPVVRPQLRRTRSLPLRPD
ncbi:hypothetical protein BT96DRAFT_989171 [Gymnopus androsaceus JB14]|uniref:Uncharacterized protein n=1 Tax=Gymnopus androsaceus JB14 TaxID=1447944 RepID=A0A6A4I2I0_9AGAR|nr:hypothetical protein BT96DRAFT_989171 [Gymnopus androsaceus JB14]